MFLDAKGVDAFPIPLPSHERIRVHRVCIALGSISRARELIGRASLAVSSFVDFGDEQFTIGKWLDGEYVHVFDEGALPTILSELSTAADFLDYLKKKEALLCSEIAFHAESELDLLAYFLWNNRSFPLPEGGVSRLMVGLIMLNTGRFVLNN